MKEELTNLELIALQKEELEHKQEELEEALKKAEAANNAKTTFLFNMSHDIRTPMSAIMGFTDMIEKNCTDPEKVKECVTKLRTASDHLLKLMNEVLDMSRIESGKVTIHETPEQISTMMEHIRNMLEPSADERGLMFKVDIDGVIDDYIWADKLHLDQILINVVSNSIKYTNIGGTVHVVVRQLADTEDGYGNYQYFIEDDGIGMSEDFLMHLYDSFTRASTTTKSGVAGYGLGMSITKQLIDMLGGSIDVKSELGRGTRTTIDFSFRKGSSDEPERREDPMDDVRADFFGKRVLIVEDNSLNREIIRDMLEDNGFMVEEAHDGCDAVDMVAENDPKYYDAVLMDVQMPIMDGYQATQMIRDLEEPGYAQLPIIAMTANAFEEDKQMAFVAGMNDHLTKPVSARVLIGTLRKLLL